MEYVLEVAYRVDRNEGANMIISERIFQVLKEKRISQKDFSEQTGIAQSTISDWKRKKTNPASDKIMAICNVLELTPYELLEGTESRKKIRTDYIMIDRESDAYILMEQFRCMNTMDRGRLLGYAQALTDQSGQST